jgi:hypothetical protein
MSIKVYYKRCWYGFEILAKEMCPMSNAHIEERNYNIDNFKEKVRKRFGTNDIEFIEGFNKYFNELSQSPTE